MSALAPKPAPILGIDLGTTNSLAAVWGEAGPEVVREPDGRALIPSVVTFLPAGGVVVGAAARDLRLAHPERTIHSVKRLIGRRLDEAAEAVRHLAFAVEADEQGRAVVRVGGERLRPEAVSAHVLRAVRDHAERRLGVRLQAAVVTVPAYFDDAQRQATRDAAKLAGLKVLRILNEPTAAALAYGLHERKSGAVAVYDLGGGTFDISILQVSDGVFRVLATHGDTFLGGDDFDEALYSHAAAALGVDLTAPRARQALRKEAERVKIALSTEPAAALAYEGRTLAITRELFERLTEPLVARTFAAAGRALADAGAAPHEIDEVVLVGGATRMPVIRRRVEAYFGRAPHTRLNPDEVVAVGAAVQAGVLAGADRDTLLLDVIPLSLGLETVGGAVAKLVERNTTVPAEAAQLFTTYADNQTAVDFNIVQGERELARDNRLLGRFKLRDIPPMPAGMAKIRVTFGVDESGILTVTAAEERSGRRARVEVVPTYNLGAGEIDRMIEEAYDKAEDDYRERMLAEIRVEAAQIIRATEKALRSAAELAAPGELQAIGAALAHLRAVTAGDDFRTIKNAYDALNAASQTFAERMMNVAVHDALAAKRIDEVGE